MFGPWMTAVADRDIEEAVTKASPLWHEEDSRGEKAERDFDSPTERVGRTEIVRYSTGCVDGTDTSFGKQGKVGEESHPLTPPSPMKCDKGLVGEETDGMILGGKEVVGSLAGISCGSSPNISAVAEGGNREHMDCEREVRSPCGKGKHSVSKEDPTLLQEAQPGGTTEPGIGPRGMMGGQEFGLRKQLEERPTTLSDTQALVIAKPLDQSLCDASLCSVTRPSALAVGPKLEAQLSPFSDMARKLGDVSLKRMAEEPDSPEPRKKRRLFPEDFQGEANTPGSISTKKGNVRRVKKELRGRGRKKVSGDLECLGVEIDFPVEWTTRSEGQRVAEEQGVTQGVLGGCTATATKDQ